MNIKIINIPILKINLEFSINYSKILVLSFLRI